MSRPAAPFVGRAGELAGLSTAVRAAAAGSAAGLVIGGDAGVGKTRLLTELVHVAREAGLQCLVGHCVDLGDTPPPYLPLTEAFGRLAAEAPDTVAELTARFPALVRLLPGAGVPGPAADDRVDRGVLFDSVRGALAHLAAAQPVALFVEDTHWADQATRDLLGYLFTRLDGERLAIVVTYRSDDLHRRHPLRRTLAEWARLPHVSRVSLDPLPSDDVRRLVRALSDGSGPSDTELEDIVRRADGNAFFAEELLAAVVAADGASLPFQLADLLLVRLDRMSENARRVVRAAAVGGRRVSHAMLEAAAQMPPADLDTALREAVDGHVLQLTSSGHGYTFRHALLAEAVYDDLLPGERVRLHAAYAAAVAAEPGHRAAELARHASASYDLATAYTASLAAGDEALALAAPQEALRHFETALELAPRVPDLAVDRPALILAAVEAADAAGYTQRGQRLAARALAELPADADPVARATLLYASVRAAIGNEIGEDVVRTSLEALQLLADGPPTRLRARALSLHSRVLLSLGRDAEAEKVAGEALAAGAATGSDLAVTEANASLASIERRKGDPRDVSRLLESVVESARESGDVSSEMRARFLLASLWYELTELDRAEREFADGHRRAVETGRQWELYGVHSRAMSATVHYIRGDWDDALRTLDLTGESPTRTAAAVLRSTAMTVRAGRGDQTLLDDLAELRPLWPREGRIGVYATFAALEIHEQRRDAASALACIDEAVEDISRLWMNTWFLARIQFSTLGLAVLAAAATGAPAARGAELAAHGARLLADGRRTGAEGLPSTREMGREGLAWLSRLEAEAARLRWLTGQDPPTADELVAAWERTVELFGFGHTYQLARSRTRLAEALRATGRADDALVAADEARAGAQRLGAAPLLAEIAALGGARRATADTAGAGGLAALTDRERDVLAELVDGRTNRQIAAKLYISEKTASVHVSNIMAKLKAGNRGEAAAAARAAGWGSD